MTPEMTGQEATAALQTLVDGAVSTGANTLLFEVQSSAVAGVYYDDKAFSPVNSALDPLKTLCELARQAGVQVIAVVEPFAAGPADKSTVKGTLASEFYSETLRYGGGLWFNPLNVRCVDRLAAVYARLVQALSGGGGGLFRPGVRRGGRRPGAGAGGAGGKDGQGRRRKGPRPDL